MPKPDFSAYLIFLPKTKGELVDKAAGPFLYSPDRYPYQDFKPDHLQQTHDSEFMLLHEGVEHVFSGVRHAALRERLHDILNRSYEGFLEDDDIYARQLIEEFGDLVRAARP
jgi:hypothetical protein